MQPKTENLKVIKWQGIKNCDTKQTESGYLWIEFLEDVTLKNIDPNVLFAKPVTHQKGQKIGFSIKALYRNHAIAVFERNYVIVPNSEHLA